MSSLGLEDEPEEPSPKEGAKPTAAKQAATRNQPPLAPSSELYLVSCCMYDIEGIHWPKARYLPPEAFRDPRARSVWKALQDGVTLARDEKRFLKMTGLDYGQAVRLEGLAGLGTGFRGWFEEVEAAWRTDEYQRIAAEMVRNPAIAPGVLARRLDGLEVRKEAYPATPLPKFGVPDANDPTVLLGDRFLNRGDGMVISSTSGMGKSSISLQQAVCYALGRDFMGIRPNGPMRSLVVQSEDSDGDIGEVWVSIRHCMKLSPEDEALVTERVMIVTERVRRGVEFVAHLRRLIGRHKPDLVWINPLQAFIEGDVTEGRDLGDFLRAGLNSLNEPPTFGFVIVHHTTKPATGRDRSDRQWHEVMYDMAGGAEIINWARAIMSLRAAGEPGEFSLVLAKRGIRAGVTREVEQGAGVRDEAVTTLYLKHSDEQIELPGRKKRLRCIFWEPRTPAADETRKASVGTGAGSKRGYSFADFRDAFPKTEDAACGFRRIHAVAKDMKPIGVSAFYNVIDDAMEAGAIASSKDDRGRPRYWLKA